MNYLNELRNDLMKANNDFRHTELYRILKTELTRLGYWKARPRGNPSKGYKAMVNQKEFE